MFCNNCGNKIDDEATYCPICGKKLKEDDSVSKKAKSKALLYGAILLLCIFVLGGFILRKHNIQKENTQEQNDTLLMTDNRGFATKQDAILYFMEMIKDKDIYRALEAFPTLEFAENVNAREMLNFYQGYYTKELYKAPFLEDQGDFYDLNRMFFTSDCLKKINNFYFSIMADDPIYIENVTIPFENYIDMDFFNNQIGLNGEIMSFEEGMSLDEYLEMFDTSELESLQVIRIDDVFQTSYLANIKNGLYGSDEFSECSVLFSNESNLYCIQFQLLKYEEKWFIYQMGVVETAMGGAAYHSKGYATKCTESEYLSELEEYTYGQIYNIEEGKDLEIDNIAVDKNSIVISDGYDSSEEAISYFVSKIQLGNYEEAMRVFPIIQLEHNVDPREYYESCGSWNINDYPRYPKDSDELRTFNQSLFLSSYQKSLCDFCLGLMVDREYLDEYFPSDSSDSDNSIDDFMGMFDVDVLRNLEIVRMDFLDKIESNYHEEICSLYKIEDYEEYYVLLKSGDEYFATGITTVKYDNKWFIGKFYCRDGLTYTPVSDGSNYVDCLTEHEYLDRLEELQNL